MSVNWAIIGPGNGLSPVRRQTITWTNAGLLSIRLKGTYFNENLIIFIQENAIENVNCQNGSHFVWGKRVKPKFMVFAEVARWPGFHCKKIKALSF